MMKVPSVAKLKKAVKAEKSACILVVDTYDNTIVAKLPAGSDLNKWDKYRYMYYFIDRSKKHEVN